MILNIRLSKESFWKDGRTPAVWSYELENAERSLGYRDHVSCTSSTSPHAVQHSFHLSHNQEPSGVDRSINTPPFESKTLIHSISQSYGPETRVRRCPGKPTTVTQLEDVQRHIPLFLGIQCLQDPSAHSHSPHVPNNDNNPASSPISIM